MERQIHGLLVLKFTSDDLALSHACESTLRFSILCGNALIISLAGQMRRQWSSYGITTCYLPFGQVCNGCFAYTELSLPTQNYNANGAFVWVGKQEFSSYDALDVWGTLVNCPALKRRNMPKADLSVQVTKTVLRSSLLCEECNELSSFLAGSWFYHFRGQMATDSSLWWSEDTSWSA